MFNKDAKSMAGDNQLQYSVKSNNMSVSDQNADMINVMPEMIVHQTSADVSQISKVNVFSKRSASRSNHSELFCTHQLMQTYIKTASFQQDDSPSASQEAQREDLLSV